MKLIACGINHKTAPLAVREQLVFVPENVPNSLQDLLRCVPVQGAALLSTCNRTELYCETTAPAPVLAWLKQHSLSKALEPHLFVRQGQAAIQHIIRVAAGLDSMDLGEPRILGQLKAAVATADQAGALSQPLQRLFQYVFAMTKRIRHETALGSHTASHLYAAVQLAKRIFADLSKTTLLFIGAGETIELAAKYFTQQGVNRLFIANRTITKAHGLAQQFAGLGLALSDIPHYLPQADIIITATASPLPLIGKGAVESAIKVRKHRPMLIIDLAVPRDVELETGKLPDVYLYSIDDLDQMVNKNLQNRQEAAQQAEILAEIKAAEYIKYLRSLNATATIRAYRDKMTALRDQEVTKALAALRHGAEPNQILAQMARALTNKFLHSPCVQLREAAYEGQIELLALAKQLFDL